ncbi:indolepyruvate ferredoxin oxidoreductase [Bradyrhizobium sp. LM3.6]
MSATQDRTDSSRLTLDNKVAVTRGPHLGERGKALPAERRTDGSVVTLNDKWTVTRGPVLINGMQAIARMLLVQSELDRSRGLKTAGYVSGYRGSPVGNLDTALWAIRDRLTAAGIVFQPGVNEDLAATAVRGTQQLGFLPNPKVDGVFAAWYGKGPGVDRSTDALKHGNYAGTSPTGGVLCLYGDDHAGKSSTVAHQSEQAMAACLIPSLYPATAAEIVTFGLYGYALSRYSGLWVGLKLVNETAEQTMTADLALDDFEIVIPPEAADGIHIRSGVLSPLAEEQVAVEKRLPLVHKFVRANKLDRTVFRAPRPRLGIVAAGKSYGDVRQGLALLGLDEDGAAQLGISLYKVGCSWPLEPEGLAAFAEGHATLLFVEEKKSFLEAQSAAILINRSERPRLLGKIDEAGEALFSSVKLLEPVEIALAIAGRLTQLGVLDARLQTCAEALARDSGVSPPSTTAIQQSSPSSEIVGTPKRVPYFCSGCPHNRSTRIPDGSLSMSGIGCHGMINLVRPEQALPPVHMGAEGGNWVGIAPFSGTNHIFQNMGDGTYYHSGLLAIRAAIAAKVNITYKILYNDAVAMTGGQPVDGPISVADIARQVRDEGVKTIVLVSDEPGRHKNTVLPSQVEIFHRDRLDEVQRRLRAVEGTSVLIYEQTCEAEKRRRRKRGKFPDPPKRLFIAKGVCEACGDCSVQSTCVSLEPVETAFGLKRRIDQSSCNKDYSCLNGFCPSFITVRNAEPRKPAPSEIDESVFEKLRDPVVANRQDGTENIILAGVGGMGVVTVAALIGMAAHLEGKAASLFDMTGLAQKNGAVYSHVRVGRTADAIATQRIGRGEATSLIAFDLVAALADESAATLAAGKTRAVLNADVGPTVDFQFSRDFKIAPDLNGSQTRATR